MSPIPTATNDVRINTCVDFNDCFTDRGLREHPRLLFSFFISVKIFRALIIHSRCNKTQLWL